ncbi:hypothetical protein HHI36_018348 [Cryptolaemus montrouzieri]|uniref:Uncharacterized protein n=1 Tax=Cryptolaemus montrouzieri TaxID=559131 RepID=A0ABD2NZM4_9CUCU
MKPGEVLEPTLELKVKMSQTITRSSCRIEADPDYVPTYSEDNSDSSYECYPTRRQEGATEQTNDELISYSAVHTIVDELTNSVVVEEKKKSFKKVSKKVNVVECDGNIISAISNVMVNLY